ncbi:MAG TPA: hypothetical protein VLX44_08915 [Xanthobacteraceae bacterium]|nr:hypothetical protein [Xanthobacteraceae bacterium]
MYGAFGWGNTYEFAKGDGPVTIYGGTGNGSFNNLQMAAGIAASDVIFQTDAAGDLLIKLRSTGETITAPNDLSSQWWGTASLMGQVAFADGTTINLNRNSNQLLTFTWTGAAGNTTMTGNGLGNNLFELGPNDVATGAVNVSNTYSFAKGDGPVTIYAPGGLYTVNTLQMAAGITASDVIFQSDAAGDLLIKLLSTGDTVTALNDLSFHNWGVASLLGQINFADGTSIALNRNWGQNLTFTWPGTAGATLNGSPWGNTLFEIGAGGTANGVAGLGSTYQLGANFGQVRINNNGSATSQVDFDPSVSDNQLWFARNGNDLDVDVLGTNEQRIVAGWYNNANAQVQSFQTADGLKLDSGVAQLVAAMATYSAANPGFNPATATQMPTDSGVQGAIAAAWHH